MSIVSVRLRALNMPDVMSLFVCWVESDISTLSVKGRVIYVITKLVFL